MNSKLSFGDPDQTWQRHGLLEYPVTFNDSPSKYKAVVRKGELVAILGRGYKLLPNEEALRIAEEAAELAGLQRFKQGPDQGTIYNKKATRMHAWFAPQEGAHPINGEQVHVGVSIKNAIDGSSAFSCGAFTYRMLCSNGVLLGYRQLPGFITRMHTKGLEKVIENLKNRMIRVMDQAHDIIRRYRQMTAQEATEKLAEAIKQSRLSKKVLPEYLKAEEPTVEITELTEWHIYNDITELIWHNADAGIKTKTYQFQRLHRIMPLRVK